MPRFHNLTTRNAGRRLDLTVLLGVFEHFLELQQVLLGSLIVRLDCQSLLIAGDGQLEIAGLVRDYAEISMELGDARR